MTSSNGSIFRVTGHLCGVFTGLKGQRRGALMLSLICVLINEWENNREAGDSRRYRVHYDVIVMNLFDMVFQYRHIGNTGLIHWSRDKMAVISHTTVSNAFPWMKNSIKISLKFVPKDPINNISALVHRMPSADQETRHYLSKWWHSLLTHICVIRSQWVNMFLTLKLKHHLGILRCKTYIKGYLYILDANY